MSPQQFVLSTAKLPFFQRLAPFVAIHFDGALLAAKTAPQTRTALPARLVKLPDGTSPVANTGATAQHQSP